MVHPFTLLSQPAFVTPCLQPCRSDAQATSVRGFIWRAVVAAKSVLSVRQERPRCPRRLRPAARAQNMCILTDLLLDTVRGASYSNRGKSYDSFFRIGPLPVERVLSLSSSGRGFYTCIGPIANPGLLSHRRWTDLLRTFVQGTTRCDYCNNTSKSLPAGHAGWQNGQSNV